MVHGDVTGMIAAGFNVINNRENRKILLKLKSKNVKIFLREY